jgi:hypothetical protein
MEGQRAGASAGGAADRAALGSAGSGSGSGTAKGRPAPSAWPKKRKASPDAAVPRERSAAAGAGAKPPKRERSSAGSPKREGPAPVLVVEVHTSVPYYAKRQEMWAESVRKGSLPIEFVQASAAGGAEALRAHLPVAMSDRRRHAWLPKAAAERESLSLSALSVCHRLCRSHRAHPAVHAPQQERARHRNRRGRGSAPQGPHAGRGHRRGGSAG